MIDLAGPAGQRAGLADQLGGLARADIRRGQDDLGPLVGRQRREIAAGRFRLLQSEVGQRHVDVAHVDVDFMGSGLMRRVARDIALALPMPDQPQALGPILAHC